VEWELIAGLEFISALRLSTMLRSDTSSQHGERRKNALVGLEELSSSLSIEKGNCDLVSKLPETEEEWGCSPSIGIGTKADEILFPIFQELDGGNDKGIAGLCLDVLRGRMHLTGTAWNLTAGVLVVLESVTAGNEEENCGKISGNDAWVLYALLDVEILVNVYIIAFF